MADDTKRPALTADEWRLRYSTKWRAQDERILSIRERLRDDYRTAGISGAVADLAYLLCMMDEADEKRYNDGIERDLLT